MPYSNVLWLYFLMEYLTGVAPKGGRGRKGRKDWERETEELRWLLHPDWKPSETDTPNLDEDGNEIEELGLGCAGDVLQYAFDVGWVHEEDLGDLDTSRLSLREDSYIRPTKEASS